MHTSISLDFQSVFESVPGLYLVLSPELIIVTVSDSYLQATMTCRDDIIGKHIFEVFPDNPDDPVADGVSNLHYSLLQALNHKRPDAMPVQQYDVRRPASEGGEFETRYWSPLNTPILDEHNNVRYLIHCVEDVTEFVELRNNELDHERATNELLEKNESMQAEIYRRASQVAETHRSLVAANIELEQVNLQLQERNVSLLQANHLLEEAKATMANLIEAYQRVDQIATRFQEVALPISLPNIPEFRFDACYHAGPSDALIGGDWYDAVQLSDGRIVVSIGDVGGSGLSAAVIMATMRQIIRGVSYIHPDPVMILDAANKAIQSEHPNIYVTAFVGVLDPIEMLLTYASAGHPPPILRHADGSLEELNGDGIVLGVVQDHMTTCYAKKLPSYSKLVLYTDGLIESSHDNLIGEQTLYAALANDHIFSQPSIAEELYKTILQNQATDDVAILVINVGVPMNDLTRTVVNYPNHWTFDASDAPTAHRAREEFSAALDHLELTDDIMYAAELVFGELMSNVVRHATGMMDIYVSWNEESLVLHVLDNGPGFLYYAHLPHDILAESGRGLFIINTFTSDFNVTRKYGGGSHARAVISLERAYTDIL